MQREAAGVAHDRADNRCLDVTNELGANVWNVAGLRSKPIRLKATYADPKRGFSPSYAAPPLSIFYYEFTTSERQVPDPELPPVPKSGDHTFGGTGSR